MKEKSIQPIAYRLLKAKDKIRKAILPSKSYMDFILHYFPDADKKKVYSVWNLRSLDEQTIRLLEDTAIQLKKKR